MENMYAMCVPFLFISASALIPMGQDVGSVGLIAALTTFCDLRGHARHTRKIISRRDFPDLSGLSQDM